MQRLLLIVLTSMVICSCSQEYMARRRVRRREALLRARMGNEAYDAMKIEEERKRDRERERREEEARLKEQIGREGGTVEERCRRRLVNAEACAARGDYKEAILNLKAFLLERPGEVAIEAKIAAYERELRSQGPSEAEAAVRERNEKAIRAEKIRRDRERKKHEEWKARSSRLRTEAGRISDRIPQELIRKITRSNWTENRLSEKGWRFWAAACGMHKMTFASRFYERVTPATPSRPSSADFLLIIPLVRSETYGPMKSEIIENKDKHQEMVYRLQLAKGLHTTFGAVARSLFQLIRNWDSFRQNKVDKVRIVIINSMSQVGEMVFLGETGIELAFFIDGKRISMKPWTDPGLILLKEFVRHSF